VAWDRLQPKKVVLKAAAQADVICFGSLVQREEPSRSAIYRLLGQSPSAAIRILDVNLRQNYYSREVIETSLRLANVLKLNDAELPLLAAMLGLRGNVEKQVAAFAGRFDLQAVALSCGPRGSLLYQMGRWSECGTRSVCVKDTVGAGMPSRRLWP